MSRQVAHALPYAGPPTSTYGDDEVFRFEVTGNPRNLVANPDVTAEIGTETRRFRARTAIADEREPIWSKQKQDYPGYAGYEAKTDRQIPVVILDPA